MPAADEGTGLSIRVPGVPFDLTFGDWVHDRFWGTGQFAAAQSTPLDPLSAAGSQAKPGTTTALTIRENNLPSPGTTGLPQNWEALIYSIQIVPAVAISLADAQDIQTKTLFEFLIGRKVYSSGPVNKFPAGASVYLFTTANATTQVTNGPPSPRDQGAFIIPHHIRALGQFAGKFSFGAALSITARDMEVHLEGLIKRPVQ